MDVTGRYAEVVTTHSRLVVVAMLLATVVVGAGIVVGETEDAGIGEFEVDTEETRAGEYVEDAYPTDDEILTQIVVREEGGDVLTRESLLEGLALQEAILADDDIADTVATDGIVGFENLVGTAAVDEDAAAANESPPADPSIEAQIEALESRSDAEVADLVESVLADESALEFLPADADVEAGESPARLTLVAHDEDTDYESAQVAIEDHFDDRFDDGFVFGDGVTDAASSSAVGDSFTIITPVALILIVGVLASTYRDLADILVGIAGIALVLTWLGGIMGWLEIPSSQLLIAVPFLLIGLSIDYAVHVVMRSREAHSSAERLDHRRAVAIGLSGVVLALAMATVSTGVGFLSNVVSPLPAIRDFALLCAAGIFTTFLVFAVFLPAAKVEVDTLLSSRFGRSRDRGAIGVRTGPVNRVLAVGVKLARRAPLAVVVIALLVASGGLVGATTIDTEFNEADFLPHEPPEIAQSLPGPFATGDYTVRADASYLGEQFQDPGEGGQASILLTGNVTDPSVLAAMDAVSNETDPGETIDTTPEGTPALETPLSVVREVAAENETVAAALAERDVTGDEIPDRDVAGLYEVLFSVDPEAAGAVLERTEDGSYESALLSVGVAGDASAQSVADDVRELASDLEAAGAGPAVATGGPVGTAVIQDALLETLVQAFAVTLAIILAFLTVVYWIRHRALSYGLVTVAPVLVALAWLLGAMSLLDIPFNSETAVITSIAIGLGVDYTIHFGERYRNELDRYGPGVEALAATMTGTGGALLGSAATTAAGFGVLALSLSPPIQRFGMVTALAIVFAFIACVTVLPSLLVVRERVLDWRS